jgi:hypothetical protein
VVGAGRLACAVRDAECTAEAAATWFGVGSLFTGAAKATTEVDATATIAAAAMPTLRAIEDIPTGQDSSPRVSG